MDLDGLGPEAFSVKVGGKWVHGPLSNGFIEPDGSHVEGEYQAYAKTVGQRERNAILFMPNPVEPSGWPDADWEPVVRRPPFGPDGSKAAGRKVVLRPDHERVKFQVMAFFVTRKFQEHAVCRDYLAGTGTALLVEGNTWHDNVWGDCRCGARHACERPGLNWLGLILMTVRAGL